MVTEWVAGALAWAAGALLMLALDPQSPLWDQIDEWIDRRAARRLDWTRRTFRRNKFERFDKE